jgi:rhamnogalacturonyl hydrolase YesR
MNLNTENMTNKTSLFTLKILFTLTCLIGLPVISMAQMSSKTPDQAVRFLADGILATTPIQMVHYKTGETFASAQQLPVIPEINLQSKYTDWHYENGVLRMAMIRIARILEEPKYHKYVADNYRFAFDNLEYFRKQFEQQFEKPGLFRLFRMNSLDDCGTMGAALIDLYSDQQDKRYREYIDQVADYILNKEIRLSNGTLARNHPRKNAVWADDLYMAVSFLARMGQLTQNPVYWNDAIRQIINFNNVLFHREAELYHHGCLTGTGDLCPAFWGRANGWVMMAQIELLAVLPLEHPRRPELLSMLKDHTKGIARYQAANGLWHQVLDKNDSYLESSCSAMFIYSLARAVNKGWIDPYYAQIANRGWDGLYANITEDAQVKDICVGTHLEMNLPFYYNRPKSVNDTHGLASTLLAGAEIYLLRQKFPVKVDPRGF